MLHNQSLTSALPSLLAALSLKCLETSCDFCCIFIVVLISYDSLIPSIIYTDSCYYSHEVSRSSSFDQEFFILRFSESFSLPAAKLYAFFYRQVPVQNSSVKFTSVVDRFKTSVRE